MHHFIVGGGGKEGAGQRLLRISTGDQSKEDTHLWASAGRGRAARSGCLGGPLLGLAVSSDALLATRHLATSSDPFVGSQGNRSVFPL